MVCCNRAGGADDHHSVRKHRLSEVLLGEISDSRWLQESVAVNNPVVAATAIRGHDFVDGGRRGAVRSTVSRVVASTRGNQT